DGEHLAYVGDDIDHAGKVVLIGDGVKSQPYDGIGHLAVSARGRIAFSARNGKQTTLVVDGKETGSFEDVAEVAFCAVGPGTAVGAGSPPGEKLAWTARRGGGWWVFRE